MAVGVREIGPVPMKNRNRDRCNMSGRMPINVLTRQSRRPVYRKCRVRARTWGFPATGDR